MSNMLYLNNLFKISVIVVISALSASGQSLNPSSSTTANEKYRLLCWLPVPIKSHHGLFRPFITALAERGHYVTLVTSLPISDPPKNLHQVIIGSQQDAFKIDPDGFLMQFVPVLVRQIAQKYVKGIFEDPAVQEFFKSEQKFDGIISELTVINEAFVGLHHKYKAPIIDVIPPANYHWAYYLYGIPYDTSYVVDMQTSFTDKMTFCERLHNTMISLAARAVIELSIMPFMQRQMDTYLRYPGWEERPSMMQMLGNVSLVLVNTHFSISYPYPMPPNAKEIGGINIPAAKPLPKDFQTFMDSAKDGVIVFSMGSHINMSEVLGPEKVEWIKTYLGGLKQKVIWKCDTQFSDLPANIKLTKWFPQTDILAHKNCKLFITHAGMHSLTESIYYAIPTIAIPVMADQMKNARIISQYQIGLELALDNVTVETISWAIDEVLTNKKYKENVIQRSLIYKDSPSTALDTAIYWTEYVIRHKGAHHLRPAIATMPWYQQAMIDVYAAIALIILLPLLIMYIIIKKLLKFSCYLFCSKSKIKEQ